MRHSMITSVNKLNCMSCIANCNIRMQAAMIENSLKQQNSGFRSKCVLSELTERTSSLSQEQIK